MTFDTIHETHISDIADVIKSGASEVKKLSPSGGNIATASSLTKATKGLIMEFPVLISKSNHIESAGIVAKAYEAKFVTLLQLAFSALNVTTSKDALDYLKQFHTNLDTTFTVDDFIGAMDQIAAAEGSNISADQYAQYKAVTEDMRNLCYTFADEVNESSLNSYKVMNHYGTMKVVKEDTNKNKPGYYDASGNFVSFDQGPSADERQSIQQKNAKAKQDAEEHEWNREKHGWDRKKEGREKDKHKWDEEKNEREKDKLSLDKERGERDQQKLDLDTAKNNRDQASFERDLLPTNLMSSEVKKANELVPTMLVVNFINKGEDGTEPIYRSTIIGVKAKLYEVESSDVINKIITKHVDSNIVLKLVKVGTREISFVKDFLLAIDDAKLDALSKSRRGSSNKLFKVLERRAIKGKVRKGLKLTNCAKAISSLVISQEEAEELLKNNIDVSNAKVIRPIMEKLNLISFAIIDESSESVKFIFDTGDDIYETIPLSKLEKEQKDGMSRKVINLLAKMQR